MGATLCKCGNHNFMEKPTTVGSMLDSSSSLISPNLSSIHTSTRQNLYQHSQKQPKNHYDDYEIDRLQLQHYLLRYVWNDTNFSSPVESVLTALPHRDNQMPPQVLDVGCGPGTWVLEMATAFSNARFYGIDISPIYPTEIKPPNAHFRKCNILNSLPFPDHTFDFVNVRSMAVSFTETEWTDIVIKECLRVMKPGAWLELCEIDMEYSNQGPCCKRLTDAAISFLQSKGVNPCIVQKFPQTLTGTHQFDHVYRQEQSCLFGALWGGKIGQLGTEDTFRTYSNLRSCLSVQMGISLQQYDEILKGFVQETEQHKTTFRTYRIYAQKIISNTSS